jgi:hypothetical protein
MQGLRLQNSTLEHLLRGMLVRGGLCVMTTREEKIRKQTAKEIFALASRIKKRDSWFIGGYLGTVIEEWKEREAKKRGS